MGTSGKTPAGSTEEKAEPAAISVVELAPTQNIQVVAAIMCLAVTQQTAASPAWYLRFPAEVTFIITKPAARVREREKRPILRRAAKIE